MTMTRSNVKISELKAKLSKYLRMVKKGGEVIVMDRETPVAKILPYVVDKSDFTIIPPKYGPERLRNLPKLRRKIDFDPVAEFIADREERDLLP